MTPVFTLDDARRAAHVLDGVAVRTPVLENADANARLGGRLLLKCENLQRTGAFKIRGAYNRVQGLTARERARGVVSYSSGNHALGLAHAAALLNSSAMIVMPADAPRDKIDAVREAGAEIIHYDRNAEVSGDVVARVVAETGRIEVPPSAHPEVLAGAATVTLELLDQVGAPDMILIPCGGGGLTAATATVMAEGAPDCAVLAAEPDQFDDTRRSLAAGARLANPPGRRTICDAIMTPIPGEMTFEINRRLLAGAVTATDAEVRAAMRFAFTHFRIVAEPGAVVGLAAILAGRVPIADRCVATVITGGNIDARRFAELLEADNATL